MAVTDRSTNFLGWSVYKASPPEMQEQFLEKMDLEKNLPLVTWPGQVGMLDGAPADILIKYLPMLYWRAQVEVWNKHLPVGSMTQEAIDTLKPEAKRYLKLTPINKLVKRWTYHR